MNNPYTDYLRKQSNTENFILRSICVHPKLKIIYFKPGKAAGTSIFRKNLQPRGGWVIHKDNPSEFNKWLQNINDKELNNYFKFTFVRNPFSRLVSYWYDTFLSVYPNFKDLVKEGIFNKKGNPKKLHFQTQSGLFSTPEGNILDLDFIGKVENIDNDWEILCNKINIPFQKLGHYTKNSYNKYTTYYDKKTIEIVSKWYKKDLEIFNYKFN
jgi:hypothetical protein|tara:strand:+ start:1985 stop:2620 length:636 start_codon:yes stop_codon:yes gene_type:complete